MNVTENKDIQNCDYVTNATNTEYFAFVSNVLLLLFVSVLCTIYAMTIVWIYLPHL